MLQEDGLKDLGADVRNKSFMKCETYCEYKYPRGINSRSDSFKIFSGPYFKAIEKQLFSHTAFIKHVPQRQRTAYISSLLSGCSHYFATDFTSFESSFCREVMNALEFELYDYMLQNFPPVVTHIKRSLGGKNVCKYRGFSITTQATRMSGDMCTSLGNGFSNLMLVLFVASEKGGSVRGVVEGDDGLFGSDVHIGSADFDGLGFDIKLVNIPDFMSASFCGLVVCKDGTCITDPRKILLKFGWSLSPLASCEKWRLPLLRAKSMSLLYEYPRCPIVSAVASLGLRLTGGVEARFEHSWRTFHLEGEVNQHWQATCADASLGVTDEARWGMWELYGIDPQVQVDLEKAIINWEQGSLTADFTELIFGAQSHCRHYWEHYVVKAGEVPKPPSGAVTFAALDAR